MRTDGELAVVRLKDCASDLGTTAQQSAPFKPRNRVFRYVRDQILIFRSDIWRANIIYGLYDLGRMTVVASRHRSTAAPTSPQMGVAAGGAHVSVLYDRRGN